MLHRGPAAMVSRWTEGPILSAADAERMLLIVAHSVPSPFKFDCRRSELSRQDQKIADLSVRILGTPELKIVSRRDMKNHCPSVFRRFSISALDCPMRFLE